ncbi:MAG: hypothetical protein ACRD6X_19725 [Pyrinomonadaceae bacterium]
MRVSPLLTRGLLQWNADIPVRNLHSALRNLHSAREAGRDACVPVVSRLSCPEMRVPPLTQSLPRRVGILTFRTPHSVFRTPHGDARIALTSCGLVHYAFRTRKASVKETFTAPFGNIKFTGSILMWMMRRSEQESSERLARQTRSAVAASYF